MKLFSKRLVVPGLVVLFCGASAAVISCNGSPSNGGASARGGVGSVQLALVKGGVTLTSVSYTIIGPNSFTTTGQSTSRRAARPVRRHRRTPGRQRLHDRAQRDRYGRRSRLRRQRHLQRDRGRRRDRRRHARLPSAAEDRQRGRQRHDQHLPGGGRHLGEPGRTSASASRCAGDRRARSGQRSLAARLFVVGALRIVQRQHLGDADVRLHRARARSRLTATVSDGDPTPGCAATLSVVVTCEPGTLLVAGSLVISSSTYDRTQGRSRLAGGRARPSWPARPQRPRSRHRQQQLRHRLEQRDGGRELRRDLADPADRTSTRPATRSSARSRPDRIRWSPASRRSRRWVCTSPTTRAGPTWCSWGTPAPGSARSTCRTPTPSRGRIRPTRSSFAFGASYAFARTIVSMDGGGTSRTRRPSTTAETTAARRCSAPTVSITRWGTPTTADAAAFGSAATAPTPTSPRRPASRWSRPSTPPRRTSPSRASNSAEVNPLIQYSFGQRQKPTSRARTTTTAASPSSAARCTSPRGAAATACRPSTPSSVACPPWPTPPRRRSASSRAFRPMRAQGDGRQLHAVRRVLRQRHHDVRQRRRLG